MSRKWTATESKEGKLFLGQGWKMWLVRDMGSLELIQETLSLEATFPTKVLALFLFSCLQDKEVHSLISSPE